MHLRCVTSIDNYKIGKMILVVVMISSFQVIEYFLDVSLIVRTLFSEFHSVFYLIVQQKRLEFTLYNSLDK